jgi:adenosylhomocysteine nucleosidase
MLRSRELSTGSGPGAMPRFGIVAAMEREVSPFIRNSKVVTQENGGRFFKFYERANTVVVCGGIGVEAARRATEAVIELYGIEVVQSVGYAGALTSALRIGDVLSPSRVIDMRDGSSSQLEGQGVLMTSSRVASAEEKGRLAQAYNADAVDMEAAAVAKGAEARSVGFSVLKVISDESDFEMPGMDAFVNAEGQFQTGRFAMFALARPWLWSKIVSLSRNSSTATRKLCQALEEQFATRSQQQADPA